MGLVVEVVVVVVVCSFRKTDTSINKSINIFTCFSSIKEVDSPTHSSGVSSAMM